MIAQVLILPRGGPERARAEATLLKKYFTGENDFIAQVLISPRGGPTRARAKATLLKSVTLEKKVT